MELVGLKSSRTSSMAGYLTAIDTKTVVSTSINLIVIGGVTYWLNNKLENVVDKMIEQAQEIEALRKEIDVLKKYVQSHEAIMFPRGRPQATNIGVNVGPSENPNGALPTGPTLTQPKPSLEKNENNNREEIVQSEPEIDEEDLSLLLQGELDELRNNVETETSTEEGPVEERTTGSTTVTRTVENPSTGSSTE